MSWQLASLGVLALVLLVGFAWYERHRPPARIVALVAALAALAVVGRLAFAAIPNVKPTTDIVLFAGYALGAVPGFAVGAVTALVSNLFLGQGPWTAWQMVAWGGVGIAGAGLARAARGRELGRVPLAVACGLAGLAFGAVLDVYQWTLAARQDLATYVAVSGSSLPYNLAHAIGNVVFCMLIGPAFVRALRRYRRRFEVRWAPPRSAAAPSAAAAALLVMAVGVALTVAPAQRARAAGETLGPVAQAAATSSPSARAVRYLRRAQNRDGGLGGGRGRRSSQLFSGWSALGLAAAGRNPLDVKRRRGRSIIAYLRRAGSIRETGELERTILVLDASGLSPRRFRGRDLVAELLRRQRADGTWRDNVGWTAFGVLALRAAGDAQSSGSVQKAANALARAQNSDGGFGFVASAQSDVDDTGAVLQALAAAGRRGSATARRAVAYLRETANPDGGFGQMKGRSSNAQSTAWAVQGLVAARVGLDTNGRSPIRYLLRLQRADGHFSYSRSSNQTPVWVTAQALTAVRRKPFPLAAVPRRRRSRSAGTAERSRREARTRAARSRERGRAAAGGEAAGAADGRRGFGRRLRWPPPEVGTKRTAAGDDSADGVPPLAFAGAGVAALALVLLARRRLRRRTTPG